MSTYKPLTDEELAPLIRDLSEVPDFPPSYYWPHILEQARRANKLAEAAKALPCTTLRDQGVCSHSCDHCVLQDALRSYLGELAPAEGGG